MSTEPLTGPPPPPNSKASGPMDHHEKMHIRAAAFHAKKVYPGPVGDLISRELLSWEDFGYRFGPASGVMVLVEHVLKLQAVDTA